MTGFPLHDERAAWRRTTIPEQADETDVWAPSPPARLTRGQLARAVLCIASALIVVGVLLIQHHQYWEHAR